MKVLALSVMLICLPSFAQDLLSGFPDGAFAGQGYWTDSEGNEGIYETYVEFNSDLMSVAYQWEDGGFELHLGFLFKPDATFDVVHEGVIAGEGFCEGDECYYDVEVEGVLYSEGLKFLWDQGVLLKSGRKDVGGSVAYWDEELHDVTAAPGPVPGEPLPIPVPPGAASQDWEREAAQQWDDRAQQGWNGDAAQQWDDRAQQRWSEEAAWYEQVRKDWDEPRSWREEIGEEWSQDARQEWRDYVGKEWAEQAQWRKDVGQWWSDYSSEEWSRSRDAWHQENAHDWSNQAQQHWSHDWQQDDAAQYADHDRAQDRSQVAQR